MTDSQLRAAHQDIAKRIVVGMQEQGFYGPIDLLRRCVVALYTGGHILLEGDPGVGKTTLVKTLNKVLGLHRETGWRRIQFTPDLLPSDITGTEIPIKSDGAIRMEFRPGPIFATLVLADEINRATPKSQSALLEAMGERQVSVLGTTYTVPARRISTPEEKETPPEAFMVFATQNPVDHEGTYELPKALLDRFMFKIHMPKLAKEHWEGVLHKNCVLNDDDEAGGEARSEGAARASLKTQLMPGEFEQTYQHIHRRIRKEGLQRQITEQITRMALVMNTPPGNKEPQGLQKFYRDEVRQKLAYGPGPRAWSSLYSAMKAEQYLFGENPSRIEGDQALLRQLMSSTIHHRVVFKDDYLPEGKSFDGQDPTEELLGKLFEITKWTG